ncbi:MAG: hypothetical protein J4215_01015 [Candidatus Diapherotrites archaeon]|uniref:Uncharacterized protein n=1 Tax=Candidatus Iainarchaeum sp. TaxID=3101447 RepID=A0A8T4L3T4_9ARCH|nr:hypothetical protein [Candidatus Diapherotrites archaeon]
MAFFKVVYRSIQIFIAFAFLIFVLSASGINVFRPDVNTYETYLISFLFLMTAVYAAMD